MPQNGVAIVPDHDDNLHLGHLRVNIPTNQRVLGSQSLHGMSFTASVRVDPEPICAMPTSATLTTFSQTTMLSPVPVLCERCAEYRNLHSFTNCFMGRGSHLDEIVFGG